MRQHGSNLNCSYGVYITGSVPLCIPAVSQPERHVSSPLWHSDQVRSRRSYLGGPRGCCPCASDGRRPMQDTPGFGRTLQSLPGPCCEFTQITNVFEPGVSTSSIFPSYQNELVADVAAAASAAACLNYIN